MNYFFRLAENWCPEASGETSFGGTSWHCEQKRWNGSTLGLPRKSVSTTSNNSQKCLQVVRVGVLIQQMNCFTDYSSISERSVTFFFLIPVPSSVKCKMKLNLLDNVIKYHFEMVKQRDAKDQWLIEASRLSIYFKESPLSC